MPKRKTIEQWQREQEEREPGFNQKTEWILSGRGAFRKIPVLLDESLEAELVSALKGTRELRVAVLPAGRGDDYVWAQARQRRRILITADKDFWNDRNYPLHDSPGVVIVEGNSATERLIAVVRLLIVWNLAEQYARFAETLLSSSKTGASSDHAMHKFFDPSDGSIVSFRF